MNRYFIRYEMILKENAIVGNGGQIGNVLRTLDCVPGSTMLGATAKAYLQTRPAKNGQGEYSDEFRELFLSEKTVYSPAYPSNDKGYQAFPVPMSVFGCKYSEGRTPERSNKPEEHGFSDCLFREVPRTCSRCGSPTAHKTGFVYRDENMEKFFDLEVSREIHTHNRIDFEDPDNRGLFSFESLRKGQSFSGEISFVGEDQRDFVYKLLRGLSGGLRIGKARNRGYGLVQLKLLKRKESIRDSWAHTGPCRGCFSVYLYSDAIVRDRALRYGPSAVARQIAASVGDSDGDRTEVVLDPKDGFKSFWRQTTVQGFNAARKMPLPAETALAKGSVFTVRLLDDSFVPDLDKLQQEGLGARKNEGFGQVVVNHSIHNEKGEDHGKSK